MPSEAEPLWRPGAERVRHANLTAFMGEVKRAWGFAARDFAGLHRWSVDKPEKFWRSAWSYCEVIAETQGARGLVDGSKMPGARFFPDARLDFAENLLRRCDGAEAIVFRGEDRVRRKMSWAELYGLVSRLAQAMLAQGLRPGDRVAGFLPNLPETVAAALALTSAATCRRPRRRSLAPFR